MSNPIEDAIRYSRTIACNNLSNLEQAPIDKYLSILKSDWNDRAEQDASSYVMATPNASEDIIWNSGYYDVHQEILPRIQPDLKGGNLNIIRSCGTCLEIGCGFGRMSLVMAKYCDNLYGVDISENLLMIARKRKIYHPEVNNVYFVSTTGNELDNILNNSIDVAFEYIVFQHIPFSGIIKQYIKEVYKKLKVGGKFIMHGIDLDINETGTSIGNTWHGCKSGHDLVLDAIKDTTFKIETEEGLQTDRYWVTLIKQ